MIPTTKHGTKLFCHVAFPKPQTSESSSFFLLNQNATKPVPNTTPSSLFHRFLFRPNHKSTHTHLLSSWSTKPQQNHAKHFQSHCVLWQQKSVEHSQTQTPNSSSSVTMKAFSATHNLFLAIDCSPNTTQRRKLFSGLGLHPHNSSKNNASPPIANKIRGFQTKHQSKLFVAYMETGESAICISSL